MKIMAIGGVPASGKSTLVAEFLKTVGPGRSFKFGTLRGTQHGNLYVLGIYGQMMFPGTDRLSMAVQPCFEMFLTQVFRGAHNGRLLFEGDRLFNASSIRTMKKLPMAELQLVVLDADTEILERRHRERGDSQHPRFLRSRETKLANLEKAFPGELVHWENRRPEAVPRNLALMRDFFFPAS